MKLILSLLLFVSSAHALTKVPIAIVRAEGPNGMTEAESYQLFYGVRERYREIGVELKLRRFINTTNSHVQTGIQPFDFGETFTHWQIEAAKKRYGRRHWAVYVMLPPVSYDSRLWLGGLTGSICGRGRNIAIGNAAMVNASGLDRLPHSQIIAQHELGHILGMSHFEDTYNVMSAIATLQFIDIGIYPPWASISVSQMQFCEERQHLALTNGESTCRLDLVS